LWNLSIKWSNEMSDEIKDPYVAEISATFGNKSERRRYQEVIVRQFFETDKAMKAFQQQEMLEIVAHVGAAMVKFGNRHEEELELLKQQERK
jgi:hypothetical protein